MCSNTSLSWHTLASRAITTHYRANLWRFANIYQMDFFWNGIYGMDRGLSCLTLAFDGILI